MSKKQKVEFSISTIMANEATQKQLRGFVEEIVLQKQKAKDCNGAIKDIKEAAHLAIAVPGKVLNKLVKEYLDDGSIDAEIEELEEAKSLAEVMK